MKNIDKSVSREQGDNNSTENRKSFHQKLDKETKYWIEEDSKYFLHQALSTPVMNVLSKTEGAYIVDLNGKKYLDLHGNGVHNAGFTNSKVVEAVKTQLDQSLAFTPRRYTNIPAIKLAQIQGVKEIFKIVPTIQAVNPTIEPTERSIPPFPMTSD